MRIQASTVIKITTCVSCVLVIAALLIAWNSPATGYESSIYRSTPGPVWILLILSLVCGLGIIIHQVYHGHIEKSRAWLLGLLLILLCYTIVLSMHIIRGYLLWGRGDVLWHLGTTRDVIQTGHVFPSNYYPVSHILVAQLSLVSGVDAIEFFRLLPVFFSVLFVVFSYCLARLVLPGKGQVILATVASTVFVHRWYVAFGTSNLAIMMLPLAFFIVLKFTSSSDFRNRVAVTILLFIIVLVYPPFHMQPALSIFIFIVTIPLFPALYRWLTKAPDELFPASPRWRTIVPVFIMVWWLAWVSSFPIYDSFSKNIYTLLIAPGTTPLQSMVSNLSNAVQMGYGTFDVINGFVRVYGNTLLYLILAVIAFPVITKQLSKRPNLIRLYSFYGPMMIFVLLMIGLFVVQNFFSPNRVLVYVIILCIMFVGFMLSELFDLARTSWRGTIVSRYVLPIGVTAFLSLISVIGIFMVYDSPDTYNLGQQVTNSEASTMEYLVRSTDKSMPIIDYYSVGMEDYWYLMPGNGTPRSIWNSPLTWTTNLRFHFGYDKEPSLGASISGNKYMLINDRFREQYVEVFPEVAEQRFLPNDFQKLEGDFTLDKVYTNGGVDCWFIHGTAASPGIQTKPPL